MGLDLKVISGANNTYLFIDKYGRSYSLAGIEEAIYESLAWKETCFCGYCGHNLKEAKEFRLSAIKGEIKGGRSSMRLPTEKFPKVRIDA